MTKYLLILFCCLCGFVQAQDLSGTWYGQLNVGGQTLRIVWHFTQEKKVWKASMDSPDQKVNGIKASRVNWKKPNLFVEVSQLGLTYSGVFSGEKIEGDFKQGTFQSKMTLTRNEQKVEKPKRPQEPQPPFPYIEKEVLIENKSAQVKLSGTLTLPRGEGPFPVVVLVSGSGPQDRNEEIMGHKPFLVIADYLTRQGIAVLRYDDRGFGKSTGNHALATTYDFASDAREVVTFVKTHPKINPEKVHLLGHSEGGLIASIVASKTKLLKSIILLAAPGERSDRVMVLQQQKILKANGATDKEIEKNTTLNEDLFLLIGHSDTIEDAKKVVRPYLQNYAKNLSKKELSLFGSKSGFVEKMELSYLNPWMYSFLKIEPHKYLKNVTCNVLAMNGSLDLQVDAKQNLSAISGKLSNDVPRKEMYEMNGLNHLFQQARTGNITEYGEIEQTFSQEALLIISNWILSF
jgi:uncharacterized protein